MRTNFGCWVIHIMVPPPVLGISVGYMEHGAIVSAFPQEDKKPVQANKRTERAANIFAHCKRICFHLNVRNCSSLNISVCIPKINKEKIPLSKHCRRVRILMYRVIKIWTFLQQKKMYQLSKPTNCCTVYLNSFLFNLHNSSKFLCLVIPFLIAVKENISWHSVMYHFIEILPFSLGGKIHSKMHMAKADTSFENF